jgi:hypothetical protein
VSSKAVASQAPAVSGGRPASSPTPDQKALADAFGALDVQVQRFKPTTKLHEAARKQLQALYDASPAEQEFVLKGDLFEIQVGPREMERAIKSVPALIKALTQKVFNTVAKVPLKVIDALVPADQHKDFIVQARTGSRSVKAIQIIKDPPAA